MTLIKVLLTLLYLALLFAGPGNVWAGGPIASGATVSGSIPVLGAKETWTFSGTMNNRVLIYTKKTSGTLATRVFLYPPGGGPAEADSGALSYLDHRLKTSGTYTIEIRDFMNDDTGAYNISYLKIPGAAYSTADRDGGGIPSGSTRVGTINVLSDLDAYQFYGRLGERVLINAVKTSGSVAPRIVLYPPDGGPKEADSGSLNYLDVQLKLTGVYTYVVMDFMSLATGGYLTNFFKIPGPVSYSGDMDGGNIVSGETVSGNIKVLGDMDIFQFYGRKGQEVVLSATKTSGTLSPRVLLYPWDGVEKEADSGALSTATCILAKTGLYSIVVRDFMHLKTGTFNLTLTKIPATLNPGIYHPAPNEALSVPAGQFFRWDPVPGVVSYDLYFGNSAIAPLTKIASSLTTNTYPIPALSAGKTYYWQVVARMPTLFIKGPHCWFRATP